jgi:glycosyltransferase involved in cell wall biosynthesis
MMYKPVYLYITPFFPSPKSWRGGYCFDAVKALMRDGRYDVKVIVPGEGGDYSVGGIPVVRISCVRMPFGLFPFLFSWINARRFFKRLSQSGVDLSNVAVCHLNTLSCVAFALKLKRINPDVKVMMQTHCCFGLGLNSGRLGCVPFHATLLYLYWYSVIKRLDLLVFISRQSLETFGKCFRDSPEGKVFDLRSKLLLGRWLPPLKLPQSHILYNGIDKRLFNPMGRSPVKRQFTVGCAANFQPLKGQITLLKAIARINNESTQIPGLRVRFIGSGETLKECCDFVSENSLESIVSFEKEVSHDKMPKFYRSIDLFVLPSRLEGFGCVYAESLACGTPFICCKNVGIAEIVPTSDRDRWLVNPLDDEDLSVKILAYYKNRWLQSLSVDLDIDYLWSSFLDNLTVSH